MSGFDQMFANGQVVNPNQSEVVKGRLYDYNLYPAAGIANLAFFAQTVGQGFTTAPGGVAGTPKTLWDTNLEMANTMPSGKNFLIQSIEVIFWPGSVATANTYTTAVLAAFTAVAAAAIVQAANDNNLFMQSGILDLFVLSKPYLTDGPMLAFPPKAWLNYSAAFGSNSATTGITSGQLAKADGRAYYLDRAEITLRAATNFGVTLRWPAPVALPSAFNARVGVVLDGYYLRASQ